MNSYSEFFQYSQNYYSNYGKKHNSQNQNTEEPAQEEGHNCHAVEQEQRHVHEFQGSTRLAEENDERHNHRFAGVSGQAIHIPSGSHYHIVEGNTDFFDHFHMFRMETGPAIEVGGGKHVHFVNGVTTVSDGHSHRFTFATLIESPLLPNEYC